MFLLTAKKKFIRNLTILTFGISALAVLIFQLFFPERYFVCFPLIPLYFYLFGLGYIHVFMLVYRRDGSKLVPLFMLCRGIKMLLSVLILLVCGVAAPQHLLSVAFTFGSFYLISLVFETKFFFRLELKMKYHKEVV